MKKGDKLPIFEGFDQEGKLIKSAELIGRRLVIFFYPKDNTPVCTKEACTFRDTFEEFKELDAIVVGVSRDSIESHRQFANKHALNFPLLSDIKGLIEKKFGLERKAFGLLAPRVTFVFDESGIMLGEVDSRFNGPKHVKESLQLLLK